MKQLLFLFLLFTNLSFSQSCCTITVRKPFVQEDEVLYRLTTNEITFYYPIISCQVSYIYNGILIAQAADERNLAALINSLKDGTKIYLDEVKQKVNNNSCTMTVSASFKKNGYFNIIFSDQKDSISGNNLPAKKIPPKN